MWPDLRRYFLMRFHCFFYLSSTNVLLQFLPELKIDALMRLQCSAKEGGNKVFAHDHNFAVHSRKKKLFCSAAPQIKLLLFHQRITIFSQYTEGLYMSLGPKESYHNLPSTF